MPPWLPHFRNIRSGKSILYYFIRKGQLMPRWLQKHAGGVERPSTKVPDSKQICWRCIIFSPLFAISWLLVYLLNGNIYRYILHFMSFTDTDIAYFYYHPKCQTINNTQNPAGYNPQALFSCHIYGIRCRRALIFEFDLHVMKLLSKYFFNIRIGVSGFKAIYIFVHACTR